MFEPETAMMMRTAIPGIKKIILEVKLERICPFVRNSSRPYLDKVDADQRRKKV